MPRLEFSCGAAILNVSYCPFGDDLTKQEVLAWRTHKCLLIWRLFCSIFLILKGLIFLSLLLVILHCFSDVPLHTTELQYDIDVGNNAPIKQHLYYVNPIKYMLM